MVKPDDSVFRDRTLTPEEIRVFWDNLHKAFEPKTIQRILKLQLVTGQRVGEVCGMARAELDLDHKRIWTIPASRSKNKHAHELPLTPLAIELIREAIADAGDSPLVFRHWKTGAAITSSHVTTAVSGAYRQIGIAQFSSHDLRRTCANSMAELGILDGVIGRVLNSPQRLQIHGHAEALHHSLLRGRDAPSLGTMGSPASSDYQRPSRT